jgi:hypothetical protein
MWKNCCEVNGNVNDGEMASNSKEDSFPKQGRLTEILYLLTELFVRHFVSN